MPFLAPLIPALVGGIASSAVGAGVNAVGNALSGNKGPQAAPTQNAVSTQAAQGAMNTATGAVDQQQALANQLAAQGGIQNQSSVYGQQQQLANQLGQMAQGQGPSVAQAQLNNATGQNVAGQAALMAGQRGAGANAGLLARQAAMQGGSIQQQAAGQGAALKQQEQLNAIGALQQQQGMLGNLATTQVGQQTGAIGNLNQFAQGQQGQLLNAVNGQNQVAAGQQANINTNNQLQNDANNKNIQENTKGLNSGLGASIASGVNSIFGTTPNPRPPGVSGPLKPNGGFAEGGTVGTPIFANSANQVSGLKEGGYKGRSRIGAHLSGFAQGGPINMVQGGHVPGQAPIPNKNSYTNDIVDAKLSPGEIVLPITVAQAKNAPEAAARFVAALKSKQGKK